MKHWKRIHYIKTNKCLQATCIGKWPY